MPEFRKGAKIRRKDWADGAYLVFDTKNELILDQESRLCEFIHGDVVSDEWELYQEPIDWDYIIKNKCLCWFWNSLGKAKYLNYLQAKEEHTFRDELGSCWDHCRPVRRDEVTFYEDRKDD